MKKDKITTLQDMPDSQQEAINFVCTRLKETIKETQETRKRLLQTIRKIRQSY